MPHDADRDAILRRRSKLMALALSGLVGVSGCGGEPGPGDDTVSRKESEGEVTPVTPLPCLTPIPSGSDLGAAPETETEAEAEAETEAEGESDPAP